MNIHTRFRNPDILFADSYQDDIDLAQLEEVEHDDDFLEEIDLLEEVEFDDSDSVNEVEIELLRL